MVVSQPPPAPAVSAQLSERAEKLRQVPLFRLLHEEQLEQVARAVVELTAKEGARLIREGDWGREFFIVLEGRAHVERRGDVVGRLGPGEFFGEIALIDGGRRAASVIADSPMRLLFIHKRNFDELRRTVPGMTEQILLAVVQRLRS